MATLDDLPPELHNQIFTYLRVYDKPVVTSKQMHRPKDATSAIPPSRVTSRLTLAFASPTLRPRYRLFLERYFATKANVVRVNVVDYNFRNFILFLTDTAKSAGEGSVGYGSECLRRFYFDGTNAIKGRDLEGPYYAVNIIFTRNLEREGTKLRRWLSKAKTIEKGRGQLRVFYKITRADDSPALTEMASRQNLGADIDKGQLKFLKEALRKHFALSVRHNADAATLQAFEDADINRGRTEDDHVSENEDAADGNKSNEDEDVGYTFRQIMNQLQPYGTLALASQTDHSVAGGGTAFPPPAFAPLGGLPWFPQPISTQQPLLFSQPPSLLPHTASAYFATTQPLPTTPPHPRHTLPQPQSTFRPLPQLPFLSPTTEGPDGVTAYADTGEVMGIAEDDGIAEGQIQTASEEVEVKAVTLHATRRSQGPEAEGGRVAPMLR